MLNYLKSLPTYAFVALLLGWGMLFRFDLSADQRAYFIGQAVAAGLAALVVIGAVSLAWNGLRRYVLVAAICVAGVAAPVLAVATSGKATAAEAYLSNKFVTDWMSENRMICAGRNAAKTNCGLVEQVTAADASTVDVVTYIYMAGMKVVAPQRLYAKSNGLCLTIPTIEDYVVSIFEAGNAFAEISDSDQPIVLSNDERAELWRIGMGQTGMRAGDELCTRFTVHEQTGNEVRALLQHVWKNGNPTPDNDGVVLHFYKTNAKLPLRDVAPSQ